MHTFQLKIFKLMCASGFVYTNPVSLGDFPVCWSDGLYLKILVQAVACVQKRVESENFSELLLNNYVPLHFNLILNDCRVFYSTGVPYYFIYYKDISTAA